MAKDPAFLFYPNDYIGGTMGMTLEEKGAYIELLMLQFNRGHMTYDMVYHTVGDLWDRIKDKFQEDGNGCFYNVRLGEEKEKRKMFTESRRNNSKGVNQHTKIKPVKSDNGKEIQVNKFDFKTQLKDLGVNSQVLDDFLRVRRNKKATNTETAFNKIRNQIEISGLTANECIKRAVERDWKGFEAKWIQNEESKPVNQASELVRQVSEKYG
jgi:uncharacterized protein YdaU (DUF1376 family)